MRSFPRLTCSVVFAAAMVQHVAIAQPDGTIIHRGQDFQVRRDATERPYKNGDVMPSNNLMFFGFHYGKQFDRPTDSKYYGDPRRDFHRVPTAYYHPWSPVGAALKRLNWFPGDAKTTPNNWNTYRADARWPAYVTALGSNPLAALVGAWSEPPVGVVKMNAGILASYARPGQPFHFYEERPDVIEMHQKPVNGDKYPFTFLPDAMQRGAFVQIRKEKPLDLLNDSSIRGFYNTLVIEIIREGTDQKPFKDFLTENGVNALMQCLTPDGVLCFHISSRKHRFDETLTLVADKLGLASESLNDHSDDPAGPPSAYTSAWFMIARHQKILDPIVTENQSREKKTTASKIPPERLKKSGVVFRDNELEIDYEANLSPRPGKAFSDWPYHRVLLDQFNYGVQYVKPSDKALRGNPAKDPSRYPTTYYHPFSPIGMTFRSLDWFPSYSHLGPESWNHYRIDARLPASLAMFGATGAIGASMSGVPLPILVDLWSEPAIGVLQLGGGVLASYGRPYQTMHFYEHRPEVLKLHQFGKYITYVPDAKARGVNLQIFEGDARLLREKKDVQQFYRVLVVEAVKQGNDQKLQVDALTKQGMSALMGQVTQNGVLCYHTSCRYYRLDSILAKTAGSLGLVYSSLRDDGAHGDDALPFAFSSSWFFVARDLKAIWAITDQYRDARWKEATVNDTAPADVLWEDGKIDYRGHYVSDPGSTRRLRNFIDDVWAALPYEVFMQLRPWRSSVDAWLRDLDRRRVAELNRK